jgi:hypothetical protein
MGGRACFFLWVRGGHKLEREESGRWEEDRLFGLSDERGVEVDGFRGDGGEASEFLFGEAGGAEGDEIGAGPRGGGFAERRGSGVGGVDTAGGGGGEGGEFGGGAEGGVGGETAAFDFSEPP